MAFNCTDAPSEAPSDAGVAGTGILLSFMITALLALLLSTAVILAEIRGRDSTIRRKILLGYSDSQIMQGIGIQSVALAKMDSLVPYHFFLVWMLSLLSNATHNTALLALARDYRRDWVLRWMRQLLMLVNLLLSSVSGVIVLQTVSRGLARSTLPVACALGGDGSGGAEFGRPPSGAVAVLSYVGTFAVISGNLVVFALATWYLHSRAQRWYKAIQVVGMLFMAAVAVGAAVRIILLSSAFGRPSVPLRDGGETDWSFGQLLSMLLLAMPLVSAVEIYRGDLQVAPPVNEKQSAEFQPIPFSRLETNFFKK